MRRSVITFLLLAICLGFAFAQSQDKKPIYISLSFVKINPGKASAYFNLLKNYSPRITESKISEKNGVLGWYMYEVRMPSGAANEYDLVSITAVEDIKLLFDELAPSEETMHKIMPGMSDQTINDIFAQYESSRTVIKKEIYTLQSDLVAENPASKYLWVDYVQSTLQTETQSHEKDRAVFKKLMPFDTRAAYNQVQTLFSNSLTSFAKPIHSEAQGKNASGDKIVFSELWQLVEYVDVNKIRK